MSIIIGIISFLSKIYPYRTHRKIRNVFNAIYSIWIKNGLGSSFEHTIICHGCTFHGLKNIQIGNYTYISSHSILSTWTVENEPVLKIGNNCNIGEYNHYSAANKIIIGNGVLTGRWVTITDNDHGSFTKEQLQVSPIIRPIVPKGEIVIDDNVWIGDKATILAGVHIGEGSIIGANSVVTKDIPPFSIAVGNPAKIIKTL